MSVNPPILATEDLQVGYNHQTILKILSLEIERGKVTALVGPNGSGKSTLLKTLARLLSPSSGQVYLNGVAMPRLATRDIARQLAILPQNPVAPPGLTVAELVEQGRFPHIGPLGMLRRQDREAIAEALNLTAMTEFAHRRLDNLSGGERQRAWISLALAQGTPLLLLDEPTSFLDIGHQLEVLEIVRQLNRDRAMTIILVLHDLNQAARYSDRMVVLKQGRIIADGTPRRVLTPELLAEAFGVRARVTLEPETGIPLCFPYAYIGNAPLPVDAPQS